ncbi:MAG: hypothetical protein GYA17_18635, partial [Chloroflexi bacterium]|nr:hypothetical protein [Chloroflexota bacterium]
QHGGLHLTWGVTTLHFSPQGFLQVSYLLEQGTHTGNGQVIHAGALSLEQDRSGGFALRIRDVELHLAPVDFLFLVQMVRAALQRLGYTGGGFTWPLHSLPVVQPRAHRLPYSLN